MIAHCGEPMPVWMALVFTVIVMLVLAVTLGIIFRMFR